MSELRQDLGPRLTADGAARQNLAHLNLGCGLGALIEIEFLKVQYSVPSVNSIAPSAVLTLAIPHQTKASKWCPELHSRCFVCLSLLFSDDDLRAKSLILHETVLSEELVGPREGSIAFRGSGWSS